MNKQLQYLFLLLGIFVGINSGVLLAQEDNNIHQWQDNEFKHIASGNIQQAQKLYKQGKL